MTPTVTPVPERVAELDDLVLYAGGHGAGEGKLCFNEAVAYMAGEPHSASPKCQSPVLRAFTMRLNDRWDDETRQRLTPYLLRCLGTAGDGKDAARRAIVAQWAINTRLPHWLELAGRAGRGQGCLMPSRRDPRSSARLTRLRQRDERTRENARDAARYGREQRESYRRLAGTTTTPMEGR